MKMRIPFEYRYFIYRGWRVTIEHFDGNFRVEIRSIPKKDIIESIIRNGKDSKLITDILQNNSVYHKFNVFPHWYYNHDWEKAERLTKQYISTHFGDAPE